MLRVNSICHSRLNINSPVTFKLLSGQAMVICGPNGSGKSSFLKILAGLLKVTSGKVTLNKEHAYMGHCLGLNGNLLLSDILKLFKIPELPKSFTPAQKTPLSELSKGQQQIIGLLILVYSNKPLWLVDEPLSRLDLNYQEWWWQKAAKHLSQKGAIVLTSHSIPQVPIIFEQLLLGSTLLDQKLTPAY